MKSKNFQNIFKSFRFEIVLYSLLSMLFTILTEGSLIGVGYLIFAGLKQQSYQSSISDKKNTALNSNISSIAEEFNLKPEYKPTLDDTNHGMAVFLISLIILLAIFLFIMYFLLLTKKFSAYLEEISSGISEWSTGNFETRIEIRNDDELTEIAKHLNKMARDISAIMDNERKTEYAKNQLITNVAHDLRTPLTSIIGYLGLVSNKELSEETKDHYISVAYNKSKRLEQLIEDLFTYTKFGFGEVKIQCSDMDIVKMIEQLADEFYPSFQENEITYDFSADQPSIMVYADGNLLARAFANLVSNAIKYGASGKNVSIKLYQSEQSVFIRIINFGELIPEQDLHNIFEKFYRVESSRNTDLGGTGLGLAIAKNIIEMHQGTIHVKSDFSGTEFKVVLPIKCSASK